MKQLKRVCSLIFAMLAVFPQNAFAATECRINGELVPCSEFLERLSPLFFVFLFFCVAVGVLMIVSAWKVYTKAGKEGWASIVPIYNLVVMMDIVHKPRWWILLMFIPLANIVISIIVTHQLALAFGKSTGFTLGLIFIPIVFMPILAFGNTQYRLTPAPA